MGKMKNPDFTKLANDLQKYGYGLNFEIRNAVRKAFEHLNQSEKDLLTAFYKTDPKLNQGERNQIVAKQFDLATESTGDKLRDIRAKISQRVSISGNGHVSVKLLLNKIKEAKTTSEAKIIADLIDVRLLPGFSSWDARAQKLALAASGHRMYASYEGEQDVTKVCYPLKNLLTESREAMLRYHEIGPVTVDKLQKALLELGFELEFLKSGKQRSLAIT